MDPSSARMQKRASFGMRCMKYMLIIINLLYVILSFLMISGATTLKVLFGQYYFVLWSNHTIDDLSNLWIATGVFLMVFSIFGIFAAAKESTKLTNIYGILLLFTFILQMATAITGFSLITHASSITWNSLHSLMQNYQYTYDFKEAMDWVQKNFECCGNDEPSDWTNFEPFGTPYYYTDAPEASTSPSRKDFMPESCCTSYSGYSDKLCDYSFYRGCHSVLRPIVTETVIMIGSSALIIGVVQIFGMMGAFMFARAIRRYKTHRDVQRWTFNESMRFDRPATDLPPPYVISEPQPRQQEPGQVSAQVPEQIQKQPPESGSSQC